MWRRAGRWRTQEGAITRYWIVPYHSPPMFNTTRHHQPESVSRHHHSCWDTMTAPGMVAVYITKAVRTLPSPVAFPLWSPWPFLALRPYHALMTAFRPSQPPFAFSVTTAARYNSYRHAYHKLSF